VCQFKDKTSIESETPVYSRWGLSPDYRHHSGGNHGLALHALAGAQLFHLLFSYGIFLPFWSVWLAGNGLTPETIGMLLGAGLVARFLAAC
jgi:hypothetical protein